MKLNVKCIVKYSAGGFTLLELLIGLALLGLMLVLIYAALNTGIRAWDTGDKYAAEAAHDRIVESFLRREFSQVFPVRWRGIPESKIAFKGEKSEVRFVTALNVAAGAATIGGLQWGHLHVADDEKGGLRMKSLFLKREAFDSRAKDWSGLDDAKPIRLLENVSELKIEYFGADNDQSDGYWADNWGSATRVPQLIRLRIKMETGREIPDLIVALRIGEEAGCYETNFQRDCGPRAQ